MDTQNHFQSGTSAEKLRGKYYTPPDLVRLILDRVDAQSTDLILDPSCGDGEFLVGAVHFLADRFAGISAMGLAAQMVGVDVNPTAVEAARLRVEGAIRDRTGESVPANQLQIHCANALEPTPGGPLSATLSGREGRLLVVGNPPYVEAKRLPREQKLRLKALFPGVASGAPDLYLYFLHACAAWLRPDDRLALVLPNRVLVNTHALQLREGLLARGQLWAIDFATRTNLFPDAAVYPVVLYASGGSDGTRPVRLANIQRNGAGLIRSPLPDLQPGAFRATQVRTFFPSPAQPILAEALDCLLRQTEDCRLNVILDIRWTVSFHRKGLRELYVRQSPEGMEQPRKFLGGGTFAGNADVTRYCSGWNGWWINYDADVLRSTGNPVPPLHMFDGPKLVICQNGRTLRAAFVAEPYVLKDTLLCGLPRPLAHPLISHPRAMVGLLCSRAVHFFYAHVFHGSHVNGGYLHFLRSFLNDIPVGEWTEESAAQVAALVERREKSTPGPEAEAWEEEIERCVVAALGLTPQQAAAIETWGAEDDNWPLRNRTRAPRRMIVSDHVSTNP